jgi:hypothetical protein
MVSNSTNINKTKTGIYQLNSLSLKKKKTTTYHGENPGALFGHQNYGGVT